MVTHVDTMMLLMAALWNLMRHPPTRIILMAAEREKFERVAKKPLRASKLFTPPPEEKEEESKAIDPFEDQAKKDEEERKRKEAAARR
eukprot:2434329-Pyramimonas_sp.AAC.1